MGSEAGSVGLPKRVTSQAVAWVVQLGLLDLSKRVTSQAVAWVVQLGLLVCPSMLPLRQWCG